MEIFYYSPNTNYTYILNTSFVTRNDAEERCRCDGGHLATFDSSAEQQEVEQYFISNYWLNIPYEREYWIGLSLIKGSSPRKYNWTDRGDDLQAQAYQNWGLGEPNNQAGNEDCGVANYSMRTGKQTGGWQDIACTRKFPFICRIKRGWRRPAAGHSVLHSRLPVPNSMPVAA